jgi:hypothetical protein
MDNEKRCAYSVYYLGLGGAKIRLLWVFFDKNLTVLKQKFFLEDDFDADVRKWCWIMCLPCFGGATYLAN